MLEGAPSGKEAAFRRFFGNRRFDASTLLGASSGIYVLTFRRFFGNRRFDASTLKGASSGIDASTPRRF